MHIRKEKIIIMSSFLLNGVIKMNEIKPEQLQSIYAELCSIVGLENVLQIYSAYKGQQVTFPQRLFSKEYVTKQIIDEHKNGKTAAEISKKYSYSTRWVNKIICENIHNAVK